MDIKHLNNKSELFKEDSDSSLYFVILQEFIKTMFEGTYNEILYKIVLVNLIKLLK